MTHLASGAALVALLVCIAIYLILALLVSSLTAPIYLLTTIALSALAAVGVTNIVYHDLMGQPLFSIVPIFAFVFLVSLGEDFNTLTIARIREEVQKLGQRRGIATAIAFTGGVISSCGLVMVASFSHLLIDSVVEVAELGFTVVVSIVSIPFSYVPYWFLLSLHCWGAGTGSGLTAASGGAHQLKRPLLRTNNQPARSWAGQNGKSKKEASERIA